MEGRRKSSVLWAKAEVEISLNEFQLEERWSRSGKTKRGLTISGTRQGTRRSLVGWGGGAIGAMMLVAPWRAAFGAKPYKIGSGAAVGRRCGRRQTAVVGLQMAADRINANGGVNGRRSADRRRRKLAGRRATKDLKAGAGGQYRLHVGGFLSTSASPACRCGKTPDRQHDRRLPQHHAHHHGATATASGLRLRAGASVAFAPTARWPEVAHRLCRLFLGSIDA